MSIDDRSDRERIEDERQLAREERERTARYADGPDNARDPEAARVANAILDAHLHVELTPRQIGRLLGLVALSRGDWIVKSDGYADAAAIDELQQLEDIADQLTRAVAQIGARP